MTECVTGMDERLAKVAEVLHAIDCPGDVPQRFCSAMCGGLAQALEPLLAKWQAEDEARGVRFNVEVACDGYAALMLSDVPESWEPDDYIAGAAAAAQAIRAALDGAQS